MAATAHPMGLANRMVRLEIDPDELSDFTSEVAAITTDPGSRCKAAFELLGEAQRSRNGTHDDKVGDDQALDALAVLNPKLPTADVGLYPADAASLGVQLLRVVAGLSVQDRNNVLDHLDALWAELCPEGSSVARLALVGGEPR